MRERGRAWACGVGGAHLVPLGACWQLGEMVEAPSSRATSPGWNMLESEAQAMYDRQGAMANQMKKRNKRV